ncbi:MAG: putative repeat protein (TIGR01451 family), partial [Myxococcota bacterium]
MTGPFDDGSSLTFRFATLLFCLALALPQLALAVDISGTVTEAETGTVLSGFVVTFAGATANQRATVDSGGRFTIDAPTGGTELEVLSDTGVSFGRYQSSGGSQNIAVQASGRVYSSSDGRPASGVRVRLLDAGGGLVSTGELRFGQQEQVVGEHGLYRFDIQTAGVYSLDIATDGQTYHFPSKLVPPQGGFAQFDATTGLVSAPASVDPKAAPPYWLTFRLPASLKVAPRHHHLAVDRGSSLVVIEKSASKSQVTTGDIVTWTLRIENRSNVDYRRLGGRGGVVVRDILPTQMRLIPESVRGFVNGQAINMSQQAGAQVLEFQEADTNGPRALELGAGERIVIRYQTVVGANARPGQTLVNRAQVVEPGGTALSSMVGVTLRVTGDDIFDRSWIRGRVYCDEDGDGWAGPRDPGVYGARVYIDTGRYAITDRDGKFHLTNVPAGLRMVKVDTDTVPPNSEPVTSISQTRHVSRGIPQQMTFGFRCSTSLTGPSQVVPAEKNRPLPPEERAIVTGKLNALSVTVDGREQGVGGAAKLVLAGAPKRGF